MHTLKEKMLDELCDYEERAKKNPSSRMSESELEKIHKLTDTVKNICKIEALEDCGYSEGGTWTARGSYGGAEMHGDYRGYENGSSYARGRRYAKRDSMGRYSRDDGKNDIVESLEDMLDDATSEKERRALRQCIDTMKNA